MVGAWCFGCCQAHRGLAVGFLLLRCSVLCTVESLSLLYLLFISRFICFWRYCIDKLGDSFMQIKHLCVLIHSWPRVRLGPWNRFKPSNKIFYWPFQAILLLWIIGVFFFCVLCFLCFGVFYCCLVVTCWERADHMALVGDVYCIFVTFPCGILGQVWYLIVPFPDFCHLSNF